MWVSKKRWQTLESRVERLERTLFIRTNYRKIAGSVESNARLARTRRPKRRTLKTKPVIEARVAMAIEWRKQGMTQVEIARCLNVSTSTVHNYLEGAKEW